MIYLKSSFHLKIALFFLVFQTVFFNLSAQKTTIKYSADASFPLGDFNSTHFLGVGAEVVFVKSTIDSVSSKKLFFTYKGGLRYFLGKKVQVSGFPYRYPGYYFLHAFAGLIYKVNKNWKFALNAGPAIGLYNNTTRFTIGSDLYIDYKLNPKLSIGPVLIFMKESGAEPLWSAGFRTVLSFN